MGGDALIWIVLLVSLLCLNIMAISLHQKNKMPLWLSGICISVIGPIIAFMSGSIFIKMAHNEGSTGEGAGIGAAFIGLIIVANGILYFVIGIVRAIVKFAKKKVI
ncbi:ABC transporter permease [Actinomycetes bacterium NPDC127524]